MEKKRHWLSFAIDKIFKFTVVFCVLFIFYLLLGVTTFATFKVPTDSMEPALLPEDYILVNKWVMGGRIFNVWDALDKKEVRISRLPGFGKVMRNDVLVFNFPYPEHWDSIGLDVMKYYVKRCIALPGDTFEIKDAHYQVRGYGKALGNLQQQDKMRQLLEKRILNDTSACECDVYLNTYPFNDAVKWNALKFGPFWVPAKGSVIVMNSQNKILYQNILEWEQKKQLTLRNDTVLLGDSAIWEYGFQENYYFVAGDRAVNSQDSRYWGVLPESFIVGKAWCIWKSIDKNSGKLRWNRILKKVE